MDLKIGQTSLKCALFSSILFWLLILINKHDSFGISIIFFWFISFIILFFISLIMNALTIVFLYEFERKRMNKIQFYKRYFPYYAILFFIVSLTLYFLSNFNNELMCILITAFFTAMMSWIWLFKSK